MVRGELTSGMVPPSPQQTGNGCRYQAITLIDLDGDSRNPLNECNGDVSTIHGRMAGFGLESDADDRVLPRPAVVPCLRTPVSLGSGKTSRI